MHASNDRYALEWLEQQLASMKGWRLSETGEGTSNHLADELARHEAWLETRLRELTRRAA